MKVSGLGVEAELQLQAYGTATAMQLVAMLYPSPIDRGQGLNPHSHGH